MVENSIYPLTREHVEEAASMYAAAFHNDPLFSFSLPKKSTRAKSLKLFFRVMVKYSLFVDECYGISSPLEGAAIWSPPGKRKISIWGFLSSGFLRLAFTPFFLSWIKALRFFMAIEKLHKKYAPDPHYYLSLLGVHPRSHGQGLAGKLLRPILKKVDTMKVGAYLETSHPKNVPIYEHFGFQVMETIRQPNGPSVWALYRSSK